jgi:3-(methylthio)propanoyl-CoA dehydrogenase
LQVHGGMGFIEETGAAQHYRDARIAPIYEGTNGIQAIDLAGRKLSLGNGQAARELIDDATLTCVEIERAQNPMLAPVAMRLRESLTAAHDATDWLIENRGTANGLAGATAYLELMGDVVGGWMLAKGAAIAANHLDADSDKWWRTRIGLARLYTDNVLTRVPGMVTAVTTGADDLSATTTRALGQSA